MRVTLDANGNLYGTTNAGGDRTDEGVIFTVDSNTGAFRLPHTFAGRSNGSSPNAGLIVDDSGTLYWTTTEGGDREYNGTIFKFDTGGGAFTVLFRFGGYAGSYPYAGLVRDSTGDLYGTTVGAGAHYSGVVFKLSLK